MEEGNHFLRKDKSGDWKERLSVEQSLKIDSYLKMNLSDEIISRISI